jgi:predicted enzyme related to lactoylglutathione lyase
MNRIINTSVDIQCSSKKAFEMFAKTDKVQSWLCGKAIIEAKVGGMYEVYNDLDKEDNTRGCKILGIDPHNYLITEWKGPSKYAELMNTEGSLTQVCVLFHPVGKFTHVTLIHSGWGIGNEWDEAYEYFVKAWDAALGKLKAVIKGLEVPPIGVTGLGGTFFKSKDPEKLKAWYDEHLDFQTDQYGKAFRWVQWNDAHKTGSTQWSVMSDDTKYFAPSEKSFMLNYRVGDLVTLLEKMKKAGVEMAGEMEEYDYGKFGWVMDPEGNKIELWEPVDEVFDNYYDQ